MASDNIFLLSFKKLAALKSLTKLRKPVLMSFAQVIISSIASTHTSLNKYRNSTKFYLTHNSQVCYLQAALNERFDPLPTPDGHRIIIADADEKEPMLVYWRDEQRFVGSVTDNPWRLIISSRGYSGTDGFDFIIKVPSELYEDDTVQKIKALANRFKLASKQYDVTILD